MIIKQVIVDDKILEIKYEEEYMKKYFKDRPSFDTKFLVRYDSEVKSVFVDINAPEWYKLFAAFHEMICCGHQFEDMVKGLADADADHRCACVERFILKQTGEYKDSYIIERINMFSILLEHNLCRPEQRTAIQKAMEYLSLQL